MSFQEVASDLTHDLHDPEAEEEQRRITQALRTLSAWQEAILAAVPDIIMEVDVNKVYTWANQAGLEFFGPDVLGREAAYYFEGEQETYQVVQPLFNGYDDVIYVESWQRRQDGEKRLLAWWCRMLKDAEGQVTGALSSARDITERIRAEDALRNSEAFLKSIIEQSPHSTWISDNKGTLLRLNQACRDLLHISDEEVVGKYNVLQDNIVQEQGFLPQVKAVFERGETAHFTLVYDSALLQHPQLADTVFVTLEVTIFPVRDVKGEITNAVVQHRDVSERVRALTALQQSEEKYRTLYQNMVQGVIYQRADGVLTDANPAALEILGLTRSQFLGLTSNDPGWQMIAEDGSALPGEEHPSMVALRTGKPVRHATLGVYNPRKHERVWLNVNAIPQFAPGEDKPSQVFVTLHDITERKRAEDALQQHRAHLEELIAERTAELKAANAELAMRSLELRESNAQLEAFAYSVSHDLRAPLRAISGFSQILSSRHRRGLDEQGQHYLDNVITASNHMSHLIDDLLAYSRLGRRAVRRQPVALSEVLASTVENLSGRLAETAAAFSLPDQPPTVQGDPTLLNQIFTNLLDNALTYRQPGVPLTISISCEEVGRKVVVRVTDNGIGIPAQFHDKIFQVFQRLHGDDEYPGTGIGLAIVKKAAEMLGGRVGVESIVGQGSTFWVELPAAT